MSFMKTPWTMLDPNKGIADSHGIKFRPIDILDAGGKVLFRISDGNEGVLLAAKIVRSVNRDAKIAEQYRG